jgi:hypothetical protein
VAGRAAGAAAERPGVPGTAGRSRRPDPARAYRPWAVKMRDRRTGRVMIVKRLGPAQRVRATAAALVYRVLRGAGRPGPDRRAHRSRRSRVARRRDRAGQRVRRRPASGPARPGHARLRNQLVVTALLADWDGLYEVNLVFTEDGKLVRVDFDEALRQARAVGCCCAGP